MSNYEFDEISVLKLFQNLQDARRKPLMQHEVLLKVVFDSLWQGGQLAAREPNVARHVVFSGPRKHSEKIFKPTFLQLT